MLYHRELFQVFSLFVCVGLHLEELAESLQKLELPFYRLTHKDYRFDVVIAFHLCDYTFISKCTLEPIIASRKATEVRIILKL